MSPSSGEVASSLFGAYRLARFDPEGLKYFNLSLAGFWNSFFAAVIVAPLFGLLVLLQFGNITLDPAPSPIRFGFAHGIGYVISWTVFPVLMISMAKFLGREVHYARFIIAYNWASVLQNALYMPLAIFAQMGMLSPDAGTFLGLIVLTAVLFYVWFVTRIALEITPGRAAAIVFIDLVVSIIVTSWTDTVALGLS